VTQYAVNDLASPGLEIGSRLPVNCNMPRFHAGRCEPVHTIIEIVAKKADEPAKASYAISRSALSPLFLPPFWKEQPVF
jgi:hypothetical protein